MKYNLLVLLLFTLNLSANPSSEDAFTYTETSCYGSCAAFEVTVFSDGTVIFNGEFHTKVEGVYRLPEAPELFQRILQLTDERGFYEFHDEYGWGDSSDEVCKEQWTDQSSTILSMRYANPQKVIRHYHGCKGFDREQELILLERALYELLAVEDYVGR